MEIMTTKTWLEDYRRNIQKHIDVLSEMDALSWKAQEPSKNVFEAIERMGLLIRLQNTDPMSSGFPTIDIMRELFHDMDYRICGLKDDRTSLIIGAFELNFVPEELTLEVTNIHRKERLKELEKDEEKNQRISKDFFVADELKKGTITPLEAARKLTNISNHHGEVIGTKSSLAMETMKNYFALKYRNKARRIFEDWNEESERRKESYLKRKKELDKALAQDMKAMKDNGLYDRLVHISNEYFCSITFQISNDKNNWREDLKAIHILYSEIEKQHD